MSLHSRTAFTRFVTSLPAVTMVEQWGSHVAKVGGKVFALLGKENGDIVFKVTELSFEGLTQIEGVGQAPYFAKRAWVSVGRNANLPEADLRAYVRGSHKMIAGGLMRKLRAELGLTEL